MGLIVFGNELAQVDDSLYDCKVNEKYFAPYEKSILTGRWGSGKTATLLLPQAKLSKTLGAMDPKLERIWYINEHAFDVKALLEIKKQMALEKKIFIKTLEEIWKAEIVRRGCLLMSYLGEIHKVPNELHWKFVNGFRKSKKLLITVWDQVPLFLKLIFNDKKTDTATDIYGKLDALVTGEAYEMLQKCLIDIKGLEPQAVVAIEPIDTPNSSLENDVSLAKAMVTSLVNVYINSFQPHKGQLLTVKLSIPWHRFSTEDLDFPQWTQQYRGILSWNYQALRNFINRRIEWEFKRVNRRFTPKGGIDAWNTLFESQVKNDFCNPPVVEDSFEFILRHTHHRPRDIQRLSRAAVEIFAQHTDRNIDEVLYGVGGVKVSGERLKQAVRAIGRMNTDELVLEAGRRTPFLKEMFNILRGVKIPFEPEDIKDRVLKLGIVDLNEVMEYLWESGAIGVMVVPTSSSAVDIVKTQLPKSSYKNYRNVKGKEFHRWFLFEYNWPGDVNELIFRFARKDETDARLVTHPKTWEELLPSYGAMEFPIGS